MNTKLKEPEYYYVEDILNKVVKINNIPRKYKKVEPYERGEYFLGDTILQGIKAKHQETLESEVE